MALSEKPSVEEKMVTFIAIIKTKIGGHGKFHSKIRALSGILLTFFIFLIPGYIFGQNSEKVLRAKSENLLTADTFQIKMKLEQAYKLSDSYPDSALRLYRSLFEISNAIYYNDGIRNALWGMGYNYCTLGQFETSNAYIKKAVGYNTSGDSLLFSVKALNNIGFNLITLGQNDSASVYLYKALATLQKAGNTDQLMLGTLYNNLLSLWSEYDKSAKPGFSKDAYQKKMLGLLHQTSDVKLKAVISDLIGTVYQSLGNLDSSNFYFKTSLQALRQQKDTLSTFYIETLSSLGNSLQKQSNEDEAIPLLQEAGRLAAAQKYWQQYALSLYRLGIAYENTDKLSAATYHFEKAIAVADSFNIRHQFVVDCHLSLANIYTRQRAFEPANFHLRLYTQLSDSVMDNRRLQILEQLETRQKVADKDKEIAQKELIVSRQENKIQRKNWLIGLSLAGIAALCLLVALMYKNQRQKQALAARQAELDALNAAVAAEQNERTRIARELHDGILSQLSGIKIKLSTIGHTNRLMNNADVYQDTLGQFDNAIAELRTTAHNMMPEALKGGLTTAVGSFCENIRANTGLNIDLQTLGSLPALTRQFQLAVYRIVQELVQNVIKHAQATELLVQISGHHQLVSVTVEDNGIGIADIDNTSGKSSGKGLQGLKERVSELGGVMQLTTGNNGTSIYIDFDISKDL